MFPNAQEWYNYKDYDYVIRYGACCDNRRIVVVVHISDPKNVIVGNSISKMLKTRIEGHRWGQAWIDQHIAGCSATSAEN